MAALGFSYALVNGTQVAPMRYPKLYHGCGVPTPTEVKAANGLPAKGVNLELIEHAEPLPGSTAESAFRGCTEFYQTALRDAGAALWGQWVYEIVDYPGYDINVLLQNRIPTPRGYRGPHMTAELEIAVPAAIPLAHLRGAGEVHANVRGVRVAWILDWSDPP